MSESIILRENHQPISKNTSYDPNYRMPADEDDEFLEFYLPTDVYDHDETNKPSIKKLISPYQEDAFTEDAVTENASTEDTAADDAVSENPLISEGESETTEEQSANADMAGTIIDSGECDVGSNVTWTLYEDGKLIIRGQGVLLDYQNEGEPWYKYKDSLFTVVVESGLTGIPGYAFSGCSSLTSIELPEDVKYFGKGVFSGCSSLTSVKLPNSMERIDSNVFSDCSSLTSIELPESIDYISDGVFSGCSSLISIELPESLEYIDDGAFSGCSSLTSIELPEYTILPPAAAICKGLRCRLVWEVFLMHFPAAAACQKSFMSEHNGAGIKFMLLRVRLNLMEQQKRF